MPKVLIIDDSQFQRRIIKGMVSEAGYETAEAQDGNSGLEMFNSFKPDIVLLDLLMPGKNGEVVLGEIKQINPDMPIIIISADIQDSTIESVKKAGAFEFLHKPPKKEQLLSTIDSALT